MTGVSQQSDPTRPKRSRARTFVPLGIAAWLVLEIWLLTLVADLAGGLTVFLLLVAGVVVGGAVVKRGGRRAWQSLAGAMRPGGAEEPSVRPGSSFTMLGGLLLMVPGLISDVAALVCLFPPTRALLRRRAESALSRRMGFVPGTPSDPFVQAREEWERRGGQVRAERGTVIQGEVIKDGGDRGRNGDGEPGPGLRPRDRG
ncbi:FxsA family protein [Streptomyces sp. 4503]|uniref:FxsA family protein n=2 Tax=Streptomyces niphimycinicus TaxID=2842201 RepID=A0ABS6CPH4_9ACTN|nr:FxsA family membrane protein [Streptomyces niphimycinicus]MBU3868803.1 FxsA family protein [Streptomyces niphimycinicus]